MTEWHVLRHPSDPDNAEHPNDAVMWCGEYVWKYGRYTHVFAICNNIREPHGVTICPDCWQALYERIKENGT